MTLSFLSLLLDQGLDPRLFVPALDAAQSQLQCLSCPKGHRDRAHTQGEGFGSFFSAQVSEKLLSTVLAPELFPALRDQTHLVI